ncbi:MAG: hypothetical protein U0800_05965 [Isosphaeraceae bacterium]
MGRSLFRARTIAILLSVATVLGFVMAFTDPLSEWNILVLFAPLAVVQCLSIYVLSVVLPFAIHFRFRRCPCCGARDLAPERLSIVPTRLHANCRCRACGASLVKSPFGPWEVINPAMPGLWDAVDTAHPRPGKDRP